MPLSPYTSRSKPGSSFSPTARIQNSQNPDSSYNDPGTTVSPLIQNQKHPSPEHSQGLILSPTRVTNSEVENEEIAIPGSPAVNGCTSPKPVIKTTLTPVTSREATET